MNKIRSAFVVGALVAASAGAVLVGAGAASATGTATPWAPGGISQDSHAVGGLEFFDASGNRITGGSTDAAPFAAYVAGLSKTRVTNDTKATVFGYVPQVGQTPDTWSADETLGLGTNYPVTSGAPAPINATALPVKTGLSSDETLGQLASNLPNTSSTSGYVNAYELRMFTSSNGNGVSVNYDYADITIDTTTHTWALVFSPDATGTATSSTLGSSATAVNQGDTVTLTDTIAPASAGTVQFKNGSSNIGTPVTVTGGVATTTALISAAGANSITAVFTPADLSGVTGSTSNTVVINATHVVATSSVALIANPTSGPAFSNVTLTATVSPSIAGQVKFFDAGAQIGLINETTGTAALTYSGFSQGDHPNITASFTPTDTTNFSGSVSAPVDFNAGAPTGAAPDPQAIEADVAAGSLAITTPYTAAHPLNIGTLALNASGTELSASVPFGDGSIATYGVGGPDGTGSIQIVDTRAGSANWTASALSTDLVSSTGTISAQNVGLTNLVAVPVAGNAQTAANLTLTPNPAGDVAPGTAGSAGLGGSSPHAFAATIAGGDGTIGVTGTLTLNAPTSTQAGHYTGTITFTVV